MVTAQGVFSVWLHVCAGKTTAINMLVGLMEPTSGAIISLSSTGHLSMHEGFEALQRWLNAAAKQSSDLLIFFGYIQLWFDRSCGSVQLLSGSLMPKVTASVSTSHAFIPTCCC